MPTPPSARNCGWLMRLNKLAASVCFVCLCASGVPAAVTIHCLDVGQGDATLIVSSSGQTLLFDAGDNGKGNSVVVPYLNALGIGQLTHIAVSHYHADHLGGVDEVYTAKGVSGWVYDRGWSYTTATYNTYANLVAPRRVTLTDLQAIDLGDGVTATVVAINANGQLPPPFDTGGSGDENDYCVGLWVQCGDFDFFAAGDLSGVNDSYYRDIETSVAPRIGELEVYRVSHHGSYSASNANFLATTLPEVAIISVGNNTYGHPAQVILNRLSNYGAFVYQTETGSGGTLPASQLRVVGGHIVIQTSGYGTYTVAGDLWTMDEPDQTSVPPVASFVLLGNQPNPFNPVTSIAFATAGGGPVRLTIYDLAGRRLVEQTRIVAAGQQAMRWDGRDGQGQILPSGVYLYRVESADGVGAGRMTLVR